MQRQQEEICFRKMMCVRIVYYSMCMTLVVERSHSFVAEGVLQ